VFAGKGKGQYQRQNCTAHREQEPLALSHAEFLSRNCREEKSP
jgi:hypothetical protein